MTVLGAHSPARPAQWWNSVCTSRRWVTCCRSQLGHSHRCSGFRMGMSTTAPDRMGGMEPISVEFSNAQTGETIFKAEPVGEDYDGPVMTLTWDEKGNARLDYGR